MAQQEINSMYSMTITTKAGFRTTVEDVVKNDVEAVKKGMQEKTGTLSINHEDHEILIDYGEISVLEIYKY